MNLKNLFGHDYISTKDVKSNKIVYSIDTNGRIISPYEKTAMLWSIEVPVYEQYIVDNKMIIDTLHSVSSMAHLTGCPDKNDTRYGVIVTGNKNYKNDIYTVLHIENFNHTLLLPLSHWFGKLITTDNNLMSLFIWPNLIRKI